MHHFIFSFKYLLPTFKYLLKYKVYSLRLISPWISMISESQKRAFGKSAQWLFAVFALSVQMHVQAHSSTSMNLCSNVQVSLLDCK